MKQKYTVYVDQLMMHGLTIRGRSVLSCHMFTDDHTLEALKKISKKIGLRKRWMHKREGMISHYDITQRIRDLAVLSGAVELTSKQAVEIIKEIKLKTVDGSM